MEQIPVLKIERCLLVSIQIDMHDKLAMALQDDLTQRPSAAIAFSSCGRPIVLLPDARSLGVTSMPRLKAPAHVAIQARAGSPVRAIPTQPCRSVSRRVSRNLALILKVRALIPRNHNIEGDKACSDLMRRCPAKLATSGLRHLHPMNRAARHINKDATRRSGCSAIVF